MSLAGQAKGLLWDLGLISDSDMTHFVQVWDAMLPSDSSFDLRRLPVTQDAEFPGTVRASQVIPYIEQVFSRCVGLTNFASTSSRLFR